MNKHDAAQKQRAIDLMMEVAGIIRANERLHLEPGNAGAQVKRNCDRIKDLWAEHDAIYQECRWLGDDKEHLKAQRGISLESRDWVEQGHNMIAHLMQEAALREDIPG